MSNDWWSKKLGGQPASPGGPPPTQQPPPQHTQAQQAAQQQGLPVRPDAQGAPENVTEGAARLHEPMNYDGIRRKSVETGNDGICPECGGTNYFENIKASSRGVTGKAAMPRCYDCGYPITHGLNAG